MFGDTRIHVTPGAEQMFLTERFSVQTLQSYSDSRAANGPTTDFLDCFDSPDGQLELAMGDTAGETPSLRAICRALRTPQTRALSHLMQNIDDVFSEIATDGSYATLFLARYDSARGLLHFVNAGHESPVLLRKVSGGYRPVMLDPTGPVIGMLRQSVFREKTVPISPGDLLAVYTDGLCGAVNAKGEEWGFRRLLETLQRSSRLPVRQIVDRVFENVPRFSAACPQFDDMTLWLGRVNDSSVMPLVTLAEERELQAVA